MAITIKQLRDYSWMSQASYLSFEELNKNTLVTTVRERLRAGLINEDKNFATQQAETFLGLTTPADGFSFQAYQPNRGNIFSGGDGFSATVFKANADGQYTIAVRGTEASFFNPQDLIEDLLGVVLAGKAVNQIIAAYRYFKQLTTAEGVQVSYTASEIAQLTSLYTQSASFALLPLPISLATFLARLVANGDDNKGLGIIPAGSTINFTGHSLGGHVASLLGNMVALNGVGTVGEIRTYNAPGLNALQFEIDNWLGISTGVPALVPTFNLIGKAGISVTSGLGSVPGPTQKLFIEYSGNPLDNHSIVKLSDSLAVYDLFTKISSSVNTLDPAVGLNKITGILEATSSAPNTSLELALDSLQKFFNDPDTLLQPTATDNREQFYTNLSDLKGRIATYNGALTIDSLVTTSAASLISLAQGSEALAYRYALKALNPFAIVGDNSLYAIHNQKDELDLYDPVAKTGSLTEAWFTDRAAFLAWKNTANTADMTSIIRSEFGVGNRSQYVDLATGYSVTLSEVELPTGSASAQQLVFGSDHGEVLNGRSKSDALYGGGGSDYLIGRLDNDYLEGGAGLDVYEYNGRTSVLGSPNNDGNDTILDTDGKGVLRYVFNEGGLAGIGAKSTSTLIRDASNRVSGTQWNSADGKFTYTRSQSDLIVTINGDAGGQITLKDFKDGDFGIHLLDAQRDAPQINTEILGDKQYLEFTGQLPQLKDPGGAPLTYGEPNFVGPNLFRAYEQFAFGAPIPGEWLNPVPVSDYVLHHITVNGSVTTEFYAFPAMLDFVYNRADNLGNIRRTDDPAPGHEDQLYDSTGNDRILAGGGNDRIDALRGGDDVIDAGEGRDVVFAGGGNDVIEGGDDGAVLLGLAGLVYGGDMLNGGAGDDELYGDAKVSLSTAIRNGETAAATDTVGDFLSGGTGNDWLVSGAADDALLGGDGNDILVGGAGNDNLFGDRNHTASSAAWTVTRQTTGSAISGFVYIPVFSGMTLVTDGAGGNDVIYAGAGDDWAFGGRGDDFIDGGSGKDVLFGDEGADVLIGGAGDDVLVGDGASVAFEDQGGDFLDGGDGNDTLQGDGGDDVLIGGNGDDTLKGGEGNDILIGGPGTDILFGGLGKDTYVFNRGDGIELINDVDDLDGTLDAQGKNTNPNKSIVVFGDDIKRSDVKFRKGSLLIDLGPSNADDPLAGNDQLHFINFNGDAPGRSAPIGEIRFADGTVMDYAEILAQGFDIDGTALDDVGSAALIGTSVTDRIRGFAGSDELEGRDGDDILIGDGGADRLDGDNGNDVLDGGSGNDILAGGMGSDDYLFVRGDGLDTLIEGSLFVRGLSDPGSTDRIVFSGDITRSDVTLLRGGDGNLTIRYGAGDEILVEGQFNVAGADIERIVFADGQVIDKAELDALEVGVVDGSAGADELYGTTGNDVLRGHDGDDDLDGGPTPERRVAGTRLVTGNDVLDGGAGADTYALYWGMGDDRIIDVADGQINTLRLLDSATLEGVKTSRDGDDLRVTLRGGGGSATVQDFFADGGAASWRIDSAADGSQSLLDVYTAQSTAANAYAMDAMADYRQQLLGEWRARGQSNFELPTRVYVRSTWSQTTAQWTTLVPALPNPVVQTITWVNDPVTHTSISAFGIQQGGHTVSLPVSGNSVTQRRIDPVVIAMASDDAVIAASASAGVSSSATSYTFNAGGGGPFANPRTYSTQNGSVTNTTTESSAEGWVPLNLRSDGLGQFHLTLQQITESPVIEAITAGAGDNTIIGMLDSSGDRVALIDAGAGDDVVTAGRFDFVFGNDGGDIIIGGAHAYGGDGDDNLSDGYFMAGGAGDDFLSGGQEVTTFHFRADEAGRDWVQDRHGVSFQDFLRQAGLIDSLSNLAYGGKYRLGGESSLQFELALEARFGGRGSDTYRSLFSDLTYAELDLGHGETQRYAVLPESPGFPRGIADGFFRGPYRSDGYSTWVYNSVEDIMRDYAALRLPFNPADVSLIPVGADFSSFTADNYRALQNFFAAGVLPSDVVELAGFQSGIDELNVGFVTPDESGGQNRVLRMVWGADKVIDIELPSATDLIGHGVEEVRFGNETVYIGDLIDLAMEEGYIGTPFDDYLRGTDGNDRIRGLAGWDFIEGGAGNDVLSGGAGIDEFFFDQGAGSDTILDPDAEDLILFGNAIEPDQIRLGLGSLRLGYGTAGDEINFEGFDPDNVYGATLFAALQFWRIEQGEEFPDGSFDTVWTLRDELTFADVLSRGFDIAGTAGNDALRGTNIHDRFYGGTGNDELTGGAGGDTYFFSAGDGVDTVVDATESGAINRVVLRDYRAEDITGFRQGNHVVLQAGGSGDAVRILWGETAGVDVVEFADGATWDRARLDQLGGSGNAAPVVAAPIGGITADEDSALNFVIPANTFQDADAGDVLRFAATLESGAALPGWLTFNAETRAFSGLPLNGDVGAIRIKVTATDGSEASASDTFTLTVLNTNDAPQLSAALADRNAVEDQAFSFAVPAGAYTDEDAGDLLTYAATLSNGAALPEWLTFDDVTNTFSGVPGNADVGVLSIRLTATDSAGASVSGVFAITVANVNDAPVLGRPLMDQAATAGVPFSYVLPAETFVDGDAGDSVTLSARLAGGAALPGWLAFDAAAGAFSGTFSGTASASHVGVLDVEVIATDAAGAAASDRFVLTVNPAAGLVLTGTAGADTLVGGYGNDRIDGLAGADQLYGGDGDDSYTVDHINDAVFENPDEGHDTVYSSVNHTLSANVENLILTGTANRNATGNALANTLIGNSGANRLDGGAGADVLVGGLGNDTYIVDHVLDQVFEAPSAGTDTVQSSVSYTLSANVEHLMLTGEAAIDGTGNELANIISGNAAANTLTGGAGNDRLIGGGGVDTLIGGTGNDFYVIDLIEDLLIEAAGEGIDTVESPFDFTLADHFENLVLTGNAVSGTGNAAANRLTGNAWANILIGLEGNDVLDGRGGADTMIGGAGDDTYVVDDSADVTVELPGGGIDTVQSSVSYAIGAEIERLVLTGAAAINGTGNRLDNRLTGNAAANVLTGLGGDDVLDGKGGADTMIGGAGNDSYIVDDEGDGVVELAGEGIDSVTAGVSFTLSAHVENLTLSGAHAIHATGNDLDNRLTGNAAANVLTGLAGNDVLDGKGGADTLIGGAGDDTYIVDSVDDVIVEWFNEGVDTVQTALTWTLGAHLENLTLTGAGPVDGAGNALDNLLIGNNAANVLTGFDGNDTLDGRGGADVMIGGAGDDHYFVDRASDVVIENAAEGNDTVSSRISYVLGDHVENLVLLGTAGISGTGNALDNVITGNSGNNLLDGGIGADMLAGGLGNDTYVVDDAGDVVVEAAAGGVDLVKTAIAYTLTANVENLTLTGTAAVSATGNALDNVLIGNNAANLLIALEGNDTLDGKAGADTMVGGLGDDIYVVDHAGDLVIELANEGLDTVRSSLNYVLGENVENLVLTGTAGRNATGNAQNNMLIGNKGANVLNGLGGDDTLAGGLGNDTYRFDLNFGHDVIIEDNATPGNTDRILFGAGIAAADIRLGRLNDDLVVHTVDRQHSIQVLNWFGADANRIERIDFANGISWDLAAIASSALQTVDLPGLLRGNDEVSVLLGQIGNTVLEGADGDDVLIDTDGNNAFIGGAGNDAATGGAGNDLFIGGAGNDTLTTGAGRNIIAYNAGGGTDTIYADAGAENTLSLGGGLRYSDLSLSRNNNDLLLNAGDGGQLVFKDWYAGHDNLLNLQLILDATSEFDANSTDTLYNRRVQNFNFLGLASAFDAAQNTNPGLSSWALSDALMQYHLSGSDDAALGGDLAYWYARNDGLAGMGLASAQAVMGAAGFGADAQSLHQFSGLREGLVHLG